MKKIIYIFLVIALIGISFSCKKKMFDYRNKYWGEYDFIVESSTYEMGMEPTDTTFFFTGTITYNKKEDDSTVFIHYLEWAETEVKVNESGLMWGPLHGSLNDPDSVYFTYHWGGLGGGGTRNVTGKKND